MANNNTHNEADSSLLDSPVNEPLEQSQGNQSPSQANLVLSATGPQQQNPHRASFPDDGRVSPVESHELAGEGESHATQTNASAPGNDASTTYDSHLTPPTALAANDGHSLTPLLSPSIPAPQPKPNSRNDSGHGPAIKSKPHRSCWTILLAWRGELIAVLLAILLLICEIVILAHYDGKFLFAHWPFGWKINAVFAFITTFIEAAISFYVGAAIGQLRWHWYRKKQHRLEWLDIMTNARQPSGAVRLLFRRGAQRQFAILGALIIILLLGVSTFTQNVITEVVRPWPYGANTGMAPIQTNYTWYDKGTTVGLGDQLPLPEMIAAMQGGFYSFATGETSASLSEYAWCDGDTCDFGEYQSLAVCGQCADMSSAVQNPCPNGDCTRDDYYTLSNGVDLSLVATNGILNLTSDTNYTVSPELSSVVGPLIVRLHAMVANQSESNVTGLGASAMECAAWWCVRTYGGKMVNGTLSEQVHSNWTDTSPTARTSYLEDNLITLQPPICVVNNTKPTNQSYCTFNAGAYTQASLQNFLTGGNLTYPAPFLTGSASYLGHGGSTTYNYTSLLAAALTSYSVVKNDINLRVSEGFETMAHYMTVSIREELASDYNYQYTYGNATIQEQRFHVRWGWLGYPISLVVFSIIFLIVTIFLSRDDEIWKSSILAMMFHAFSDEDRRKLGDLNTAEEMETIVRERKVILGTEDTTGQLLFKAGPSVPRHGSGYDLGDKAGRLGAHGSEAGFNFLDGGNINVP